MARTSFENRYYRRRSFNHPVRRGESGIPSQFTHLAFNRPYRPAAKLVAVFENFHRHLIIAPEGLIGVGPKRFHLVLAIVGGGRLVGLEIQPALVNDSEKGLILVQTVAAEHATRSYVGQCIQLIEHEIFK
jgi:hypothetical protein